MNGQTQSDNIRRKLVALSVGTILIAAGTALFPEHAAVIKAGAGATALTESIRQQFLISERSIRPERRKRS